MLDIIRAYQSEIVVNANLVRDTNNTDNTDHCLLESLSYTLSKIVSYNSHDKNKEFNATEMAAHLCENVSKFIDDTDWGLSGYSVAAMLTDIHHLLNDVDRKSVV